MINLIIKYGKRKYYRVDIEKLISHVGGVSMSKVKRMLDQGGVTLTIETDREKK